MYQQVLSVSFDTVLTLSSSVDLVGGCYLELLFALDGTREMFPEEVGSHHREWAIGLARLIGRAGYSRGRAWAIAEEIIGSIEGALVLARAMGDPRAFSRAIKRLRTRLQKISRRQMP